MAGVKVDVRYRVFLFGRVLRNGNRAGQVAHVPHFAAPVRPIVFSQEIKIAGAQFDRGGRSQIQREYRVGIKAAERIVGGAGVSVIPDECGSAAQWLIQ